MMASSSDLGYRLEVLRQGDKSGNGDDDALLQCYTPCSKYFFFSEIKNTRTRKGSFDTSLVPRDLQGVMRRGWHLSILRAEK